MHLVSGYQLALACIELGERDRAVELLKTLADNGAAQSPFWVGRLLLARALLAEQAGDYAAADRLLEQTVAAERAVEDQPGLLQSLTLRGAVALERGNRQLGTAVLAEALEIAALYGSKLRLTHLFEALAFLMLEPNPAASVRLAAAAEQLRTALGAAPLPSEQARVGRNLRFAKRRVGEPAYAELWMDAQGESLDAILVEARQLLDRLVAPVPQIAAPALGDALSEREAEVAALVTRGLSNRQIAGELVISLKTTEAHVHHVLNKLGLSNRVQIATWGLRHGVIVDNRSRSRRRRSATLSVEPEVLIVDQSESIRRNVLDR